MLPPARQSATSGVNMRSTLGKSLLREEVHETTSRMDTQWGVRCLRGIGYGFGEYAIMIERNVQGTTNGLEGFL